MSPSVGASGNYNTIHGYKTYDGSSYIQSASIFTLVQGAISTGVVPQGIGFSTGSADVGDPVGSSLVNFWLSPQGNLAINKNLTDNGRKFALNGSMEIEKDSVPIATSTAGMYILLQDTTATADSNRIKRILPSSLAGNTLYTGDGTLSGNRTVTGGSNSLTWDAINNFRINSTTFTFAKNNGTIPYSGGVGLRSANEWEIGHVEAGIMVPAMVIDTNNNVLFGSITGSSFPTFAAGGSVIAGNNFLSLAGNYYHVSNLTTGGTVSVLDYWINIDATAGNITLTLPAASSVFGFNAGIQYVFKRIDNSGNTITIQRAGSDTIDGATSFTIVSQWDARELQCTSTSTWNIK